MSSLMYSWMSSWLSRLIPLNPLKYASRLENQNNQTSMMGTTAILIASAASLKIPLRRTPSVVQRIKDRSDSPGGTCASEASQRPLYTCAFAEPGMGARENVPVAGSGAKGVRGKRKSAHRMAFRAFTRNNSRTSQARAG